LGNRARSRGRDADPDYDAPITGDGIDLSCTCPAIPLQFEGTVDGTPAYFRYRGGEWRFTIHPIDPVRAGWNAPAPHTHWEGERGGEYDGWMPHAEAESIIRRCVAEWREHGRPGATADA
jgi:hypothetical protein